MHLLLTVLVDEHTDGYSAHVESVQEVLYVLISKRILAKSFFVLDHSLGHGGYNIVVSVSDIHQCFHKPEGQSRCVRLRKEIKARNIKERVE